MSFDSAVELLTSRSDRAIFAVNLLGIDGCRGGWVLAWSDETLRSPELSVVPNVDAAFRNVAGGRAVVAIDIPIGLSEDSARGCDIAARAILGARRRSSVFPAPCRATLEATSYRHACELNFEARGKRVSQQLYNILHKIAEVDRLISPSLQERVREAHPEVVFATLAGTGRGLVYPKKSAAGEAERLGLLAPYFPGLDVGAVRAGLGAGRVARDDIVDAVGCLVTAYRVWLGEARVLPEDRVELDRRGLRMEIVA